MTLTLQRLDYREDGIFSELLKEDGSVLAFTCEHSYNHRPKLYLGTFICKRGTHRLHSGPPFKTFEVTGVNGHSGILFHKGNTQVDSNGCILVGEEFGVIDDKKSVLRSKEAFATFIAAVSGLDEFTLLVR